MDSTALNTAPMLPDEDTTMSLRYLWREHFMGCNSDFYRFITTPSPERERLLSMAGKRMDRYGDVNAITIVL